MKNPKNNDTLAGVVLVPKSQTRIGSAQYLANQPRRNLPYNRNSRRITYKSK